jgi:chromosome partitioning protein
MRTIAVMNQKGGVGKTTTTVNLGATLAELGQRVLLVDLDPQAHLTIGFGIEPVQGGGAAGNADEERVSLYNVLVEERPLMEAIQTVDEHIALVPSSIDLAAAEIELVSILGRETLLKKRVEAAKAAGGLEFDFVLLDCPPSLGLLTLNALAVADEVIVPMQPQFLPLQGMAKLLETVQLVNRRMNPGLKVSGIVLTMFDSQTKLSNEVVAELSGFIEQAKGQPLPWSEAKLFKTKIRRNIKLAESPSFGQNILKYDPASNGAADYRNLAKEVVAMREAPVVAPVVAPAPAASPEADAAPPVEVPAPDGVAAQAPAAPAPEATVQVNRGIDPTQLAAAKADLEAAKAEIAAARARIAAAKKKPGPGHAPAAAAPLGDAQPQDTEAVA